MPHFGKLPDYLGSFEWSDAVLWFSIESDLKITYTQEFRVPWPGGNSAARPSDDLSLGQQCAEGSYDRHPDCAFYELHAYYYDAR
jgi:hypothetical protein